MEYWINSNSGDYVMLDNVGKYTLCLIARKFDDPYYYKFYKSGYIPESRLEITHSQFITLKGFVPIKAKKLFNRRDRIGKIAYTERYAPTIKGGLKGESKRMSNPLSKADARESILKELGL